MPNPMLKRWARAVCRMVDTDGISCWHGVVIELRSIAGHGCLRLRPRALASHVNLFAIRSNTPRIVRTRTPGVAGSRISTEYRSGRIACRSNIPWNPHGYRREQLVSAKNRGDHQCSLVSATPPKPPNSYGRSVSPLLQHWARCMPIFCLSILATGLEY